ncbi:MAG: alpha/beta fold hydrolase [Lachnospirales bacterium]
MEKTIKDLKTSYIEKGEQKDDLIFIFHGWGSKKEVHMSMIDTLSLKYRVIAVDLCGFGNSEEPKTPWFVDDYVDFSVEFIKSFNADKVILLGHSFGCRIIIKMLNKKNLPFKVEKAIFTGGAGIKPKRPLKYYLKVYTYKFCKKILNISFVKQIFPNALEKYSKNKGSADYINSSPIMKQTLTNTVNEDLTPLLKNINIETLLIWGENDTATPLSDGQRMEKDIKNSGLVVLKNAGHFSFIDQEYTFNEVLKSFLKIGGK